MITDTLQVSRADFEARTGWELKPEGACKGEHCIPLRESVEGDMVEGESVEGDMVEGEMVDLSSLAAQLNLPLVHDESNAMWALGPESMGGRALATAQAPNLTLPTLDGEVFELSSLRGKKVLLVAWSPY